MSRRIVSCGFIVALAWSTVVVLRRSKHLLHPSRTVILGSSIFPGRGRLASSTDQNEGMYELSVTQGVVKLYELNGSQKNEIPVQPDGPSQDLLRLVGKSDQRPDLKFPLSAGQKWTYEYVTRPPWFQV